MNNLKADKYVRKFLNSTSKAGNDGGIKEFEIEDPTYVTFRLEFLFEPIESAAGVASGLLLSPENPLSAVDYLIRIDEPLRAKLLSNFINDLRIISEEYPWYFTSISGLSEFTKIDLASATRITNDKFIEVECIESLDMRMTKLFDLYRKATFDTIHMRDMLPSNMREFNMRIHITEFRKFHSFTQDNFQANGNSGISPLMRAYEGISDVYNLSLSPQDAINNAKRSNFMNTGLIEPDYTPVSNAATKIALLDNFVSVLTFNLGKCVFDFNESNPFYESVTTSGSTDTSITQKFKFSCMKLTETNTYPIAKMILRDALVNSAFQGDGRDGASYSNVDDIIERIWPKTSDADILSDIATRKENELRKTKTVIESFNAAYGKYAKVKSSLEDKLNDVGINYNPLESLESEVVKRVDGAFNKLILGNIYDITPTNLINTVKNKLKENDYEQQVKESNFTIDSASIYDKTNVIEPIIEDLEITKKVSDIKVSEIEYKADPRPLTMIEKLAKIEREKNESYINERLKEKVYDDKDRKSNL